MIPVSRSGHMQQPGRWTFAGFEIDLGAGLLRKNGEPVRIGPQAFRALALLVSRGGELVTREELQKEIWGDRVHVDFEHGLNVCIRQVRTALGDDAEGNQIIVTCPREGYRLGVPVKRVEDARRPSLKKWAAAAAVAALVGAGYLLAPSLTGDRAATSDTASLDPTSAARLNGDLPQSSRPIDRVEARSSRGRGRRKALKRTRRTGAAARTTTDQRAESRSRPFPISKEPQRSIRVSRSRMLVWL